MPAYHDARLYWEQAFLFAERPWLPFVFEFDPGHPPLVSWMLGVLWAVGVPRHLAFHLLAWAFASLWVAATFEFGRRVFGMAVGLFGALLLALHPVVWAQAIQLNLDLPLSAFLAVALLGAAVGNARMLAIGAMGLVFAKLNGMFLLGPLILWVVWELLRREGWRDRRMLFSAAWPIAIPLVAFVLYHAMKVMLTGHLFDTGEFARGEQTKLISTPQEFLYRVFISTSLILNYNGNMYVVAILALVISVCVLAAATPWGRSRLNIAEGAREGVPFWRPMTATEAIALLWALVIVHVVTQSIRLWMPLARYYMPLYPALFFTLLVLCGWLFPRGRALAMAAVCAPLLAIFVLKWHPKNIERVVPSLRDVLVLPPDSVGQNFETSLEFVDQFRSLRRAMEVVDRMHPEGTYIRAPWPIDTLVIDPRHGITRVQHRMEPAYDGERVGAVLDSKVFRYHMPAEELPTLHPGCYLYRLYDHGRPWIALYLPEGSAP